MSPASPNILLLLTDDQGPWALGHETPELITPTLDRLIDEGTYLRRFFCASPVCSPARASLLTGRMPSAHGVHDWLRPDGVERPQPPGSYIEGCETIAQMLSRGGYQCAHVGKWHLGYSHEPAPGYVYWYAHQLGGSTYYDAPVWAFDESAGRTCEEPIPTTEPRYFTDAVGDQALDFLDRRDLIGDERPFYLELATTAPHAPWVDGNHPDDLVDLYAETSFPSVPNPPPHPWFRTAAFQGAVEDRHANLAGYAAAVTGVDRMLARVLDALEQRGLLEDTIIVFTSDNGFSCGHHGIWGKGNGTIPLNFWENSVRVPFIAWGPGRIAAGRSVDTPVSATSVYETLAELADVAPRPDPLRAGSSVASLLRADEASTPAGERAAEPVVVHDEYGGGRMIRTERWKLILRADGPDELYDLEADAEEERDLSVDPAFEEIRRGLESDLARFFSRHSDPALDGWALPVSGHGQLGPLQHAVPDAAVVFPTP